MSDSAHDHVGSCSPCFSELTEIREALHRRSLIWATGTASVAVLAIAVLVFYFGFHRVGSPLRQEAVQPRLPTQTPQVDEPNRGRPPSQPDYVAATLDLRNASVTRTVQSSGSTSNPMPIDIPRGMLALTVELPIGSEAGSYQVELRRANQPTISATEAQAKIDNGITKLVFNIDTRSVPSGEYQFSWRLADFSWRNYPVLIR